MLNQRCFRITLVILALCLSLGSQAILPMSNAVGQSVLEVSEVDFEQAEFEEDLLATIIASTVVGFVFSKLGVINPDCQTADLLLVSPPPKHA